MNQSQNEAMLRPERVYPFGDSLTIDAMRREPWYAKLDTNGKACVEGWVCGCPIVQELIKGRGAEVMLNRYTEVNDMYRDVMGEIKKLNPALFGLLDQPTQRVAEEQPYHFEIDSVPEDYSRMMPRIGSLVGYALPRIMIELYKQQQAEIDDTDIEDCIDIVGCDISDARDPYELLARVAGHSHKLGVSADKIFHHMFIEGWLDEHSATSMMAKAARALHDFAPELFAKYVALTPGQWKEQELHMDFSSVINRRSEQGANGEAVGGKYLELKNFWARVEVRERGGYITHCLLEDPNTMILAPVLFCDEKTRAKATATHPMSPVGPSDGVGGQHGPWRWADFRQFPSDKENILFMQAERRDVGEPTMTRVVDLATPSELTITNTLTSNRYENPEKTSLGEHIYFVCEERTIPDMTINDTRLDELLPPGVIATIMAGEPYHWIDNPESLTISFRDGRVIELSATSAISQNGDSVAHPTSYLIWHKPGTNSICIEPVVGYKPNHDGQIDLTAGSSLQLRIRIRLASAGRPLSVVR